MPLMVTGNANKPRVFKGKSGHDLEFNYHSNKKYWMTQELFRLVRPNIEKFSVHLTEKYWYFWTTSSHIFGKKICSI